LKHTRHITDKFWHGSTLGCGAGLEPWLRDRGSLTQRIQQRCVRFSVRGVNCRLARVALDESALLGISTNQLAYTREVFLYAEDDPVVFAHSAVARQHLHGAWTALRTLGNRPLGTFLFAHPLVERKSLYFKALHRSQPLYRHAVQKLGDPPDRLWARRSLFYLHGAPLLVTEVFLPDVLRLSDHAI